MVQLMASNCARDTKRKMFTACNLKSRNKKKYSLGIEASTHNNESETNTAACYGNDESHA